MTGIEEKAEAAMVESGDLVDQIAPMFVGKEPEVVGPTLAELTATYLAGLHPDLRSSARALFVGCMDDLVPIVIEEMIEAGRCPEEWRARPTQ